MENNSSDFNLVEQAEDIANRYWHYRETHCTARKYVQDAIRLLEMALEQCETCPHKGSVLSEVIGGCLANFKGPNE